MSESKPILYIFAISHYCEKARWALDYLGIDYDLVHLAPGEHVKTARRLGAPRSHLPYLSVDGQVVQGSAEIIDWADNATSSADRRLAPDSDPEECVRIEKRLDNVAGVHIRRYFYSEAMVEHPGTVRPIFVRDLPLMKKLMVSLIWRKVRKMMMARMDLGRKQGQESKDITAGELDWLDGLLSDGRDYLIGNRFSRADIAAASLLAPLALPPQHPTYANVIHPPRMAIDVADWDQRLSIVWIRKIYEQYR